MAAEPSGLCASGCSTKVWPFSVDSALLVKRFLFASVACRISLTTTGASLFLLAESTSLEKSPNHFASHFVLSHFSSEKAGTSFSLPAFGFIYSRRFNLLFLGLKVPPSSLPSKILSTLLSTSLHLRNLSAASPLSSATVSGERKSPLLSAIAEEG